jgi:hypothetical protein
VTADRVDLARWLLDGIVNATAELLDLDTADLLGRSRRQPIAYARQLAYWAAREVTALSLPELGRYFGRHHSTVHHGAAEIERLRLIPFPASPTTPARTVLSDSEALVATVTAKAAP